MTAPDTISSSADADDARAQLLARVVEHVATTGLGDVSLRQLAAAVGTSHRMLNYHFGGRDGLVAAIVESVESQQRAALDALADEQPTPRDLIVAQWAQLSDPELRPFIALFFEVLVLGVHGAPGTDGFLSTITDPWIELGQRLAADFGTDTNPADIRLGIAVVRGLLLDVLASGRVDEATESLERFLDLWYPDES